MYSDPLVYLSEKHGNLCPTHESVDFKKEFLKIKEMVKEKDLVIRVEVATKENL